MTRIYTVGHSNRSIEDFLALLNAFAIERIADVRSIPHSAHNPQFDRTALEHSLRGAGVGYVHLRELGGFRRPRPDSVNCAWRNERFRGYADYMQSERFAEAISELLSGAHEGRTALMCAEALPWRCHRSLIADALIVRGVEVVDILGVNASRTHRLTAFARVEGTTVTYPHESVPKPSSA